MRETSGGRTFFQSSGEPTDAIQITWLRALGYILAGASAGRLNILQVCGSPLQGLQRVSWAGHQLGRSALEFDGDRLCEPGPGEKAGRWHEDAPIGRLEGKKPSAGSATISNACVTKPSRQLTVVLRSCEIQAREKFEPDLV